MVASGHLEIRPVILSEAKDLRPASQILRFAQDDRQETSQVGSREVFSPKVWVARLIIFTPF